MTGLSNRYIDGQRYNNVDVFMRLCINVKMLGIALPNRQDILM